MQAEIIDWKDIFVLPLSQREVLYCTIYNQSRALMRRGTTTRVYNTRANQHLHRHVGHQISNRKRPAKVSKNILEAEAEPHSL